MPHSVPASPRLVAAAKAERRALRAKITQAERDLEAARRALAELHDYDARLAALIAEPAEAPDRTETDDDHDIARELAARLGAPDAILGPSRQPHLVEARAEVFRELRALGWSYPRIGRAVGRDHTTIHAAVNGKPTRGKAT
jgi:chromosomal replication initiation ATPase DnaA